jgi:cytochrome c-type biogenesis protein CcmH/NrfG
MRRPMFLQGKVMLADGSQAPPNIVIERVCNGTPIPESYTDSKGGFSFEVGRNSAMIADASTSSSAMGMGGSSFPGGSNRNTGFGSQGMGSATGGITEQDLSGCELRASLAGYRSTIIQLTGRRMFDNPDVGTLILTPMANVSGFTISATTLQAPKKARKALENGLKEASKKKWDKAENELRKSVGEYPEYAEAWYALGQVLEAQQKTADARQAYGKALEADGKYVSPYLKLARMEAQEQNWAKVVETTNQIVKLNPYDFPDAFFYSSIAHLSLNNNAEAEQNAREAIERNVHQRFPQLEQILGLSLANQMKYKDAAEHLKKYLELVPGANNAEIVQKQIVQLESFVAQQTAQQ